MGENKGKGTKGRNYDELSGVGTSSAGITGTTGNLNNGVRDGGIGKPSARDSGNRAGNMQSADLDDDVTPALGTGSRSGGAAGNQQSGQPQGQQSNLQQSGSQSGSQQSGLQQSGSQQSGSQQFQSGQSGSQQSSTLQSKRSLDQDVLGKEN
ncbi:hypothetical protein LK540_04365 [Massilia sp. IC2-278]|uniref:hypothetical protein n=1 Tax=Massilia sp. IC2-278 TaxID=2887200 RepID=UPI001E4AD6B4|nr:hypothetical protein [Massilia sp. IC2-278]MCC2959662.1 hypothetical protein [Massilia sp. IC2-278]